MFNTHRRGIRIVLGCFREKLAKNTKMGVYLAKWGCVNRLLHLNFIRGPLMIASEGLTSTSMEFVKLREVSEGKQPKKHKNGGGVNLSI